MLFENLEIIKPIQKALKEEGYKKTTPIQEKSIPYILDGKDLVGCAQTGTGKTAAFAVPVLQNLSKDKKVNKNPRTIRALVLAPTRELAIQIGESFECYGKYINLKSAVIFGGVSQNPQTKALREGVDILIATPGRMLDLFNQKYIDLRNIECFVLDEADRMLDMGMIHDVKKIISKLPKVRQNLLFSATMPSEITKLVDSIVKDPIRVEVTPVSSTVDTITQEVYHVRKKQKRSLLKHLLKDESIDSALVFSTTKRGANMIAKDLVEAGIEAEAIHGNKSQNARQRALNNFKEGNIRVLVATDIAARGIDVNELSHVFNYNLPDVPETYVHRIGRTGRAGAKGVAISFCDIEETKSLKAIEKLIHKEIPVVEEHPYKIRHINEDEVKEENTNNNSNKKPSSKRQGGNWRYSNNRRKNNSTKQIKK
ncbi:MULTISPECIES: DEAD/DEAH box helicase [Clostridium]|uniref:ATP-dependent RNA helicase CshA n=2 Tax=Bacteria TaxID=2 RepID=A0A7U4XT93_CLOSG|nr:MULTISPECIES: DEAD/DEAH box helicase [Clostridium]AJD29697.1 DEAD/DEAH box helicase family protein [Clostridium botulinum Prevot_594]AVP61445.1 DEAD/DEAH box helicase [Clostridium botulinum]AKC61380.1 ATP-dependent RNA helicase RhlE [Clostridium sporogenes]AKJ88717.1 DEAD/DEAH box helicase [Clostridium sporogenes]EHN15331.1 ATP-dependent RNA helicase RhlE [Clostridium sporogenes PA 3679]